jgi:ParB family chromosome partitioning protein
LILLSATSSETENCKEQRRVIAAASGKQVAQVTQSKYELKISVNLTANAEFAAFLVDQLPGLFEMHQRIGLAAHQEE